MNKYIHYLEFGSGEPLILLPSNWLTSKSYQSIAKKLSNKYRVIVPDLYRGRSRYEKNAFTSNDYVLTLNTFLDSLKIKKFYVIGFSFSGMVAIDYVKKYPSKILKMMLVSSIKFPLNLKNHNLTLIEGLIGYMKLFYHNTFSLKGIKVNILWLNEGIKYFFNHTKQFFIDARIAIEYSQDESIKLPFPIKILIANRDEYITYNEIKKINNIEIDIINGYHAWFFLNENLLIEKISNYLI
jgi:pimeloyl-ACP methyl ester carboxylesterase